MKITTNFSSPAGRLIPYLTGTLVLSSAVVVVVSIVLLASTRQISAELPILEEQIAHYRGREIPKPVDLLPQDKLVALRTQVQVLNRLTGSAGQALPLLLAHLEKLIPDGVWLVNLQYRAQEGETKLVAEADRTELLTEFMGKLDRSGHFSQVLLTRQAQRSEGAKHAIQFEIQLRGKS